MSTEMQTKVQASPAQNFMPVWTGILQRKSALCNTPGLVEDSGRDKEKLTLQRSLVDQAGTTTVPRFGHDFSRVSVHSTRLGMIQTKLKINEPGDIYEQEADRVADAVMRMPEPRVQRQFELEGEEEETLQAKPLANEITPLVQVQRQEEPEEEVETLQAKPLAAQITPLVQRQVEEEEEEFLQAKSVEDATPAVTHDLESRINAIRGGGQPLAESERAFFEPKFGVDFGQVRVHTDVQARESARAVNARAYTLGQDVVFGLGHYAPGTAVGRRLMAHELTHVVQQTGISNTSNKAGIRGPPIAIRAHSNATAIMRELSEEQETNLIDLMVRLARREPLSDNLAAIQILGTNNEHLTTGQGFVAGDGHAEEIASLQVRNRMAGREGQAHRMIVVVTQFPCEEHCQIELRRLQIDLNIDPENVELYQVTRPARTGGRGEFVHGRSTLRGFIDHPRNSEYRPLLREISLPRLSIRDVRILIPQQRTRLQFIASQIQRLGRSSIIRSIIIITPSIMQAIDTFMEFWDAMTTGRDVLRVLSGRTVFPELMGRAREISRRAINARDRSVEVRNSVADPLLYVEIFRAWEAGETQFLSEVGPLCEELGETLNNHAANLDTQSLQVVDAFLYPGRHPEGPTSLEIRREALRRLIDDFPSLLPSGHAAQAVALWISLPRLDQLLLDTRASLVIAINNLREIGRFYEWAGAMASTTISLAQAERRAHVQAMMVLTEEEREQSIEEGRERAGQAGQRFSRALVAPTQ